MAIKATCSVTLSSYRDTQSVTRYYKLQSSTAASPSKPTTNPPSGWTDTEPSYTSGSTNTLYFCDLTVFSDGTWAYSNVSKSSSYEAAKEAYNKAQNAQNTADNAQSDIDNLPYVGSNILLNSSFAVNTKQWDTVTSTVSASVVRINDASTSVMTVKLNRNVSTVSISSVEVKKYGKNIYKPTSIEHYSGSTLSIATIDENGKVTLSGSPTSMARYHLNPLPTLQAGKYTISTTLQGLSKIFVFVKRNGSTVEYSGTSNYTTFEIQEDDTIQFLQLRVTANTSIDSSGYFQIEVGETATDYETYIEPEIYISNDDGVVDGVTGVSPVTTLMTNVTDVLIECEYNAGAFVSKYGKTCVKFNGGQNDTNKEVKQSLLTKLEPNTQYTFSGWFLTENITDRYYIGPMIYDSNTDINRVYGDEVNINTGTGEWQYYTWTLNSFTESTEAVFDIKMQDFVGDVYFCKLKLEKGKRATDWSSAPEDLPDEVNDFEDDIKILTETTSTYMSNITKNTESISMEVRRLDETVSKLPNDLNEKIEEIENSVELLMTDDSLQIEIDEIRQNGVNKVKTSTDFTFDENGLNISKTDASTSTQIDETGMYVTNTESGSNNIVLTANDKGVDAKNLRATTYLIIGGRSRFENYGTDRTACFWIGE